MNNSIGRRIDARRSLGLQVLVIPVAATRCGDVQHTALHLKVVINMNAVLYRAVDVQRTQRSLQLHVLVTLIGMFATSVDGQCAAALELTVSLHYHAAFLTAAVLVGQHIVSTFFQHHRNALAVLNLHSSTCLTGKMQSFERKRNLVISLMDKGAIVALS